MGLSFVSFLCHAEKTGESYFVRNAILFWVGRVTQNQVVHITINMIPIVRLLIYTDAVVLIYN